MIKYDIPDTFVNQSVNYPFNITKEDGSFIADFWVVINMVANEIKNDTKSRVRFIWIDAETYCQTEIFLKRILFEHHESYPVLYLHWIDFVNKGNSIYDQLHQEKIGKDYFINYDEKLKICVVDHAEEIGQKEQYLKLCKGLTNNRCIFIFLSKKDSSDLAYWKQIVSEARTTGVESYLGITRSEKNYYQVKPYTYSQCKEIFFSALTNDSIKTKSISMLETLLKELRRPYYFDFLVKELNSYRDVSHMPEAFNDPELIIKIYSCSVKGILDHISAFETLKEYIEGYYSSGFVKNYMLGDQSRVPHDNYAWAHGVINCSFRNDNSYNEVISTQFNYNENHQYDLDKQVKEINKRIVSIFFSTEILKINSKFVLKDYLCEFLEYSQYSAYICAAVLNECFEQIEEEVRNTILIALGKRYCRDLDSINDIRYHCLLGFEIGKLLPKANNDCIAKGLEHIYSCVCDNYVEPKCNSTGISVIPVTNFEFEKFVKDNGYKRFYSLNSDKPLNEIAVAYYKEILNFIIGALSGCNRKDSKCLARLLRGYDWDQYKQIAYLLSRKDDINNEDIYKAICINYPEDILYPAKWADCANTSATRPFCNPLQPVVCINIFEARAYAKWLSEKIKKPVRLLNYDPDYLSIIGASTDNEIRRSFSLYVEDHRNYFNSVENDTLYYGSDDIELKEPSPVATPNTRYLDLYDFIGNVFETQDTPFTYNYGKNSDAIKQELKKNGEIYMDYNCPGGGLQRTAVNWPPEYMGQVPAFLRNQDIGFRIVIGTCDVGSQEHMNRKLELTHYSESAIETYTVEHSEDSSVLSHLQIKYDNNEQLFENDFDCSGVFSHRKKQAKVFMQKNKNSGYKESILLVLKGEDVFAYHLIGIASIQNNGKQHESELQMIVRKPIVPEDLAIRKKRHNQSCAEWIDLIELVYTGYIDTYIAYPINISNGYFKISDRNVRDEIFEGYEVKKLSALINSYLISFTSDSQTNKKDYYAMLKEKLGADFFLPDWIDIVDFINNIATNMSINNVLDVGMVMAAITTIDTSDLHEQINKKILSRKVEKKDNE